MTSSLLIARRSIGLASCKETWNFLWFPKLRAIDEANHIILNCITVRIISAFSSPLIEWTRIRWTSSGNLLTALEHRLLLCFVPLVLRIVDDVLCQQNGQFILNGRTIARTSLTTPVNIGARCKLLDNFMAMPIRVKSTNKELILYIIFITRCIRKKWFGASSRVEFPFRHN